MVDGVAQLCGTDNAPRAAARPSPADTVLVPPAPNPAEPADQNAPAPEPRPPGRANPGAATCGPTALRTGANVLASCSAEDVLKIVALDVDISELSELNNVNAEVDVDGGDGTVPGTASCCNALGIMEVSVDDVACASAVIDVPVACATAAPWAANPAGLVAGGAGTNGVNVVAAADEPA